MFSVWLERSSSVCLCCVCSVHNAKFMIFFSLFFHVDEIKRANRREVHKGWRRVEDILKSGHRPEEGMSYSPCPLLEEEWNYPSFCAHTSFLLQVTSFPLWNWHPQFILISLLSTGHTRAPFWGVSAMAINRVSRHGLANAAHYLWGNPSETTHSLREMLELCRENQSIAASRDGDISYLSPI